MNRAGIKPSLLDVVNGTYSLPGQVPGQKKVQTIFRLMIEIDALAKRFGMELRRHFSPGSEPLFTAGDQNFRRPFVAFFNQRGMEAEQRRFLSARIELAKLLEAYTAAPRMEIDVGTPWPWHWHMSLKVPDRSFRYIEELAEYAKAGDLMRFRQCAACDKWFFARVDHQRCCSLACRQKLHRSSPEFKEKRRLYMRQLRRQHKGRLFTSDHPPRSPKSKGGK
jgi:hypothetical protein